MIFQPKKFFRRTPLAFHFKRFSFGKKRTSFLWRKFFGPTKIFLEPTVDKNIYRLYNSSFKRRVDMWIWFTALPNARYSVSASFVRVGYLIHNQYRFSSLLAVWKHHRPARSHRTETTVKMSTVCILRKGNMTSSCHLISWGSSNSSDKWTEG